MSEHVTDAGQEPFLRVLRGEPSAEELAALVVALSALGGQAPAEPAADTGGWAAYWRGHRNAPHPGTGVWRHSLR